MQQPQGLAKASAGTYPPTDSRRCIPTLRLPTHRREPRIARGSRHVRRAAMGRAVSRVAIYPTGAQLSRQDDRVSEGGGNGAFGMRKLPANPTTATFDGSVTDTQMTES